MIKNISRRNFLGGTMAGMASAFALPNIVRGGPHKLTESPYSFPHSLPNLDRPGETQNTRFACNIDMWFKDLPFMDRLQATANLGFPAIEFWLTRKRSIEAIGEKARELGLEVAQFTAIGFHNSPCLNHPESDHKETVRLIEEACAYAEILPGCKLFTVVAGNDVPGASKEAMHASVIRGMKKVAPILEREKKTAIIEPMNPYGHPGHCLYGSKDVIEICKAVESPNVKINWDVYHMQRSEGNIIDNMMNSKEFIAYLQIADSPGRGEPGTGEINHTNLFQAIKKMGYNDYVGVECWPIYEPKIAASYLNLADLW